MPGQIRSNLWSLFVVLVQLHFEKNSSDIARLLDSNAESFKLLRVLFVETF